MKVLRATRQSRHFGTAWYFRLSSNSDGIAALPRNDAMGQDRPNCSAAKSCLSPVATQHSLPSGCYSLLGPDLHRLDRTSLRLAHLFDHLVGRGEQRLREGEAKRLCGLEIDVQHHLGGLLDR